MHDIFRIRRATAQDAEIIAWHRARMFQDMGDVSDDTFRILRSKARVRLKEWLESGDHIGWFATPSDKTGNDRWRRGRSVATDPAAPAQCIDNWRRPAGNDCECFYRTAMATARNRWPAR